jgi:hypothetical protein
MPSLPRRDIGKLYSNPHLMTLLVQDAVAFSTWHLLQLGLLPFEISLMNTVQDL